jgi:DNA repair protein SbcD/Mre11
VKLAHLADLHLGFRQFDRQTPRGGNQREVDVAEAFRRAVDDLLGERPDLIVIAGDVFHSVRPTNPAILFLFQQLQRVRTELPDTPVVVVAGNHDTPRSAETGAILRLYETLGIELALEVPRRLVFPRLDCAVLAVPHQAIAQEERPALRPERGATHNILVVHATVPELGGVETGAVEYGGATLSREELGLAQWDYVALGDYNVAHAIAPNAWYSGSLDYLPPSPWVQLREEAKAKRPGKGYLLVHLPGPRVEFRPIEPPRRFIELPAIQGEGLTAKDIDHLITERVTKSKRPIDDAVVRLTVWDVSRGTARDLDHEVIRGYKARALNFQLDIRRPPPPEREVGMATPGGRRLTLPETVKDFLSRRPLDADLDREAFVRTGVEYVEQAGTRDREEAD